MKFKHYEKLFKKVMNRAGGNLERLDGADILFLGYLTDLAERDKKLSREDKDTLKDVYIILRAGYEEDNYDDNIKQFEIDEIDLED